MLHLDCEITQAIDGTKDGGALLHFGQQSDDLAARLVAVVVHVYAPPARPESVRKAAQLSPTLEVSAPAMRSLDARFLCAT